jgi:hypothetical protein
MVNPAGESNGEKLRIDLDRRLNFTFINLKIISGAGLPSLQELRDVLELAEVDLIPGKCTETIERIWCILIR